MICREDKKTDSSQNEDSKNKKIINDFQGVADYIQLTIMEDIAGMIGFIIIMMD